MSLENLEIKEIEISSPIECLKIGGDFLYKGFYINGYEEGVSKIKRFYKEVPFWDGVAKKFKKNDGKVHTVWMELENHKRILLGYMEYNDKLSDKFRLSNETISHLI